LEDDPSILNILIFWIKSALIGAIFSNVMNHEGVSDVGSSLAFSKSCIHKVKVLVFVFSYNFFIFPSHRECSSIFVCALTCLGIRSIIWIVFRGDIYLLTHQIS
jgi:hypothetical protein